MNTFSNQAYRIKVRGWGFCCQICCETRLGDSNIAVDNQKGKTSCLIFNGFRTPSAEWYVLSGTRSSALRVLQNLITGPSFLASATILAMRLKCQKQRALNGYLSPGKRKNRLLFLTWSFESYQPTICFILLCSHLFSLDNFIKVDRVKRDYTNRIRFSPPYHSLFNWNKLLTLC